MSRVLYKDTSNLDKAELLEREYSIEKAVYKLETQGGQTTEFIESVHNYPQSIFLISHLDKVIVGRKLISDLYRSNQINFPHCSKINKHMILGELLESRIEGSKVKIVFQSYNSEKKSRVFHDIRKSNSTEIRHPFRYVDINTGLEKTSPEDGWKLNINKAKYLGAGETHIREYTKVLLSNRKPESSRSLLLYDPACSTGQFLSEIKSVLKHSISIGQDLSREMVNYAKGYLDICCEGNAIEPCVGINRVDYLFLRFLNSEVVSTDMAKSLFNQLVKTLKPSGICICFGHTPVLVDAAYMKSQGLEVKQSIAKTSDNKYIFQYYQLEKQPL